MVNIVVCMVETAVERKVIFGIEDAYTGKFAGWNRSMRFCGYYVDCP